MWNAVKGFGEINGHCCGSCWGFQFIKSLSNSRRQWEECRGSGVFGFKAMLGRLGWEGGFQERKEKPFKDFGSGRKE